MPPPITPAKIHLSLCSNSNSGKSYSTIHVNLDIRIFDLIEMFHSWTKWPTLHSGRKGFRLHEKGINISLAFSVEL